MTPEKDLEATHVVWTISNSMLILIHGDVMAELLTSPGSEVPGETIEGRPLLTVETGVNGDSKRTKLIGALPWLVRWACRAGTRYFCFALTALVSPVQNIIFLTAHFFTL